MPQPQGVDARVALYEETTYKTDPGSPSGMLLYWRNFRPAMRRNLIDSGIVRPGRGVPRPMLGNISVDGDFETELAAEWMARPLKHLLGQAATVGTGPYTHTITIGTMPVSMLLEKNFGSAISGSGSVEKLNGCRFASAEFNFPVEGPLPATFSVIGANRVAASAPLDATLDEYGHTSFSSAEGSVEEGGSAIARIRSGRLRVENTLEDDVYAWGGAGVRRSLPNGRCRVSGNIELIFEDLTVLNKAVLGTETSLRWILSRGTGLGSAGNEYMEFLVQQLQYEPASPPIEGEGGIYETYNFRGYATSANNGLQVIVKNAVSAA